MKKIIFQGVLIIVAFLASWFCITQINWVNIFHVQKLTNETEKKLGKVFLDFVLQSENEIKNPLIIKSVDSIVSHICINNNIAKDRITIHVIQKDEINAFAMPDGHLILYTGLIQNSENPEELTGVLCHELAHIQLNHVMKKLLSEMGLSVLITLSSGNGSPVIVKEALKKLSSITYERGLEKEADLKAVDYMIEANVNPSPFANFLYRQSLNDHESSKYFQWISSHPDSKERSVYILEYSKKKNLKPIPILNKYSWDLALEELN